jgi:Gametolysin peptidase M11/NPCBM-associated, NEW3 domain of alpha-galactosidase
MTIRICTPRIFSRAIFAGAVLLASTFVFAHNPDSNAIDPVAAAQWKAGAPQVQLEGQIEIIHQDFKDGHGKFVYTLKQADGTRVPLQFVKHPPTHLLTGDHVQVSGQRPSSGLVLYSGGNVKNSGGGGTTGGGTTSSSIPVPNTFGSQSVLVIVVNFQDDATQPFTVSDVQNAFFNTSNNFFVENSYQQTSLTGDVVGWYTIPDSVTTCNMSQIATDAQSAASRAGVNLASYARYVYAFPYNSVCGWAGASDVGGNPSQSWINGGLDAHTINHELGHAFGLWHSHWLDCGSSTICSSGTVVEYGDLLDTMGTPQTASADYNAFQKERLGWLGYGPTPSIQTVTTSGTYTINTYEIGGSGPNALKILKSTDPTTGAKTWYYLEQRQAIGFDAFLTNGTCSPCYTQNETTGVLFHLGTDGDGNSSELIDMTPATPSSGYFDPSLVVGQTFQDSTAGVTIAPTAVSSTGATVQITMNGNGSACTAANPTVTVSPSQSQGVISGTAVNFTATVTDNDSSGCTTSTFNLAAAPPSGWAGAWSAAAVSLSPGKSGSATLTVTSPTGTADGSYNLGVTATNASATSYTGSAAATYVISTPGTLSVSMWTDQSTYLPGQTVAIRVSLLNGTSPDVGASVTVNVMSPSGKATTLSGTTGSNGVASLSYKLSRHAPAGTYQAQYGTTVTGAASVAGASTSFTVQ